MLPRATENAVAGQMRPTGLYLDHTDVEVKVIDDDGNHKSTVHKLTFSMNEQKCSEKQNDHSKRNSNSTYIYKKNE